jgi:AcrR family transcriptional regulator
MKRGRPANPPEEVDEFKQKVCKVALRLISKHGVEGLSFRNLARGLGSSHTRVHGYFENKEAIIRAVRDYAFGEFAHALEETGDEQADPMECVRLRGAAYYRFAQERTAPGTPFAHPSSAPSGNDSSPVIPTCWRTCSGPRFTASRC